MFCTMSKMKNKKGFTLMEMLIVVAIIAILVAIAIPVFSAQLTKANEQVDAANLRSATSMAVSTYLLNGKTGAITYRFAEGNEHTMTISEGTAAPSGTEYPSKADQGHIVVVVGDGGDVTSAGWSK